MLMQWLCKPLRLNPVTHSGYGLKWAVHTPFFKTRYMEEYKRIAAVILSSLNINCKSETSVLQQNVLLKAEYKIESVSPYTVFQLNLCCVCVYTYSKYFICLIYFSRFHGRCQ